MTQVFKSNYPTLAAIKKQYGQDDLLKVLTIQISGVVNFFNVGKGMTPEQIGETASLIYDEFYYLNLADFKLCFNNAKKGLYGKLYDRLDGAIIFEWLVNYSNDRINKAEYLSLEEHKQYQESRASAKDIFKIKNY